jgi:hypothetical protein
MIIGQQKKLSLELNSQDHQLKINSHEIKARKFSLLTFNFFTYFRGREGA